MPAIFLLLRHSRRSLNFHSNLKHSLKCYLGQFHMENNNSSGSRGARIVLEGLELCGKTSQSCRLLKYLEGLGYPVDSWRFPDRGTGVGQMISSYLANESQLDDNAIHLLFSANRWERRSLMETKLMSGTTLVVDRYSYYGVAFSSAKFWILNGDPEMGLLAPDIVLYLDILPEIIDACLPTEDDAKQMKEIVLASVPPCRKGKSLTRLWST